jgi:hypothetical protein
MSSANRTGTKLTACLTLFLGILAKNAKAGRELPMTTTTSRLAASCAAAVLALGLAACGGSTTSSGSPAPAAAGPTNSPGAQSSGPASTSAKVSANTASEEEIAAALQRAGVSNADRWAEEAVEYRPYPADDPNLTKLRDELAKYNPGQETIDKIVSALMP